MTDEFEENEINSQNNTENDEADVEVVNQEMNNREVVNQEVYNTERFESRDEDLRTKQLVEKEKIKFEKKRAKATAKMEKKAAKKAAKANKKHGIVFKCVSLVASAAVFGVVALGTMYVAGDALDLFDKEEKETVVIPATKVTSTSTDDKGEIQSTGSNTTTVMDVSDIVENIMPSVVAITSTQMVQSGYNDLYNYFFGYGNNDGNNGYEEQTGAGSGIIIGQNEKELLIVTNNHVVEGADSLQVQFIDDESVEATIKGTDSELDLAVVAVKLSDIKDSTLDKIKTATLGDSDALKVGEPTIAIGNALGYGQSVTTGVVSALNREVTYENSTKTLIQTDAAINPGNSGGALLNIKGEVIGINAAKYSSSSVEGMGFAIPVSSRALKK